MANEDKPRSPIKDAGWLVLFLIVIGVIWFAQGGPSRLISMNPFLNPPVIIPSNSSPSPAGEEPAGEPAGSPGQSESAAEFSNDSRYKGKIHLSVSAAREKNPQEEYLEISAVSETEPISITGWTLKGREGLDVAIGQGAYLAYSGQINPQNYIYLEPGGKAIIATGRSLIGTSFRLNTCTGYFNQFQKFFPYLAEECPPVPEKEMPLNYADACFDFIRNLPRCRMPLNIPFETAMRIGNDCVLFVNEKANYSDCVNVNKNEEGFYKKEWRIYLGRDKELWGNQRDSIILRDQKGKIVDKVSY